MNSDTITLLKLNPANRDATSAWFGDIVSRTWGNQAGREPVVALARPPDMSLLPRALTGKELEDYGISGSGRTVQIRRQYRRTMGVRSLAKLSPSEAPERPEMLGPPRNLPAREWVLVPKDEFSELQALEQVQAQAVSISKICSFSKASASFRSERL